MCHDICRSTTKLALTGKGGVLASKDLETMGDSFVEILARLKHNGATGRCIEGFVAVAER